MYCVECGNEGKLYENLCEKCFRKKANLFKLPPVLKVTICGNCNAREKAKHWEQSSTLDSALRELVREHLTIKKGVSGVDLSFKLSPEKTNILRSEININGKYKDISLSDTIPTEIRITFGTCGRCSRLSGSYFEAKIQIRAQNRALDEAELEKAEIMVNEMLERISGTESNAFLTKNEYIHGGEDFYIGSSSAAKQIAKRMAKEFSGKLKESSTLLGRKDGRDVYRLTINIRLPELKVGDFIDLDRRLYYISEILPKRIITVDLKFGQKQSFAHSVLEDSKVLGNNELIYNAVVVFDGAKEVQVLDPDTYRTVELVKPRDYKFDRKSESVLIFKNNEDIYLLPNNIKIKNINVIEK
jgi:nonsense-mediated mRNA decay protein 3